MRIANTWAGAKSKVKEVSSRTAEYEENNYVKKAEEYIRSHLSENIFIVDIGNAVHLNSQYAMRLYKKKTGMTILQYITEQRVVKASKLLKDTVICTGVKHRILNIRT